MKNQLNNIFISALPRHGRRAVFIFILLAGAILLPFLGKSELLSAEYEWAAAARLMSNAEPVYGTDAIWCPEELHVIFFGRILREAARVIPVSEWLLRLPSLLAALAAIAGTVILALTMLDRKNGICTGWLMLGSYGFLYWGRTGGSTMLAAALTVWALLLFYGNLSRKSSSFRRIFDCSMLLILAWLLCGLSTAAGIILLLLPRLVIIFRSSKFSLRSWFDGIVGILSALLFSAAVLYITVYSVMPEREYLTAFWRMGSFLREFTLYSFREFITPAGNSRWEALFNLPRLLLPWTLFLPVALWGLWKSRERLSMDSKALLTGMVLYLLLLGIFPHRRWGSLLPLLGPAVMFLSAGVSARFHQVRFEWYVEHITRALFIIAAALACALFCTWPLWLKLLQIRPPWALMVLPAALGLSALAVLTFGVEPGNAVEQIIKRPSPLAGTVLAGVILSILVNIVVLPEVGVFRTGRDFWLRSGEELEQCEPAVESVIFYRVHKIEPALFYLKNHQNFRIVSDERELENICRNTGGRIAVISNMSPRNTADISRAAAGSRRRFEPAAPQIKEASPVVFTSSESRSADANLAMWMLSL